MNAELPLLGARPSPAESSAMIGRLRTGKPMQRYAFTLIELLVVITILVALAGMLIPIVAGAQQTADDTHCKNNLTQLGKAIIDWRIHVKAKSSDKFPGRLMWLSDSTRGGQLEGQTDIYKCPYDDTEGTDPDMGRPASWNSSWGAGSPFESGSSYLYEVSNLECPWAGPAKWNEWKRWQRKFGNGSASFPNSTGGRPFPASRMPIIRCFHHFDWETVSSKDNIQEVYNVAWDTSFFKGRPEWEMDLPSISGSGP